MGFLYCPFLVQSWVHHLAILSWELFLGFILLCLLEQGLKNWSGIHFLVGSPCESTWTKDVFFRIFSITNLVSETVTGLFKPFNVVCVCSGFFVCLLVEVYFMQVVQCMWFKVVPRRLSCLPGVCRVPANILCFNS